MESAKDEAKRKAEAANGAAKASEGPKDQNPKSKDPAIAALKAKAKAAEAAKKDQEEKKKKEA